ncbi:MAG: hypothetical protein AAAFM81_11620 [Pseudomonadota bacterium]
MSEISRSDDMGIGAHCMQLGCTFAAPQEAEAWRAASALRDAILASATTSKEASVCRVQLQWWSEEITRLVNAEPRHPVSKGFASHGQITDHTAALMQDWLVLAERLIDNVAAESFTDTRVAAYRHHGVTMQIAAGAPIDAGADYRDASLALSTLDEAIASADPAISNAVLESFDQPAPSPQLPASHWIAAKLAVDLHQANAQRRRIPGKLYLLIKAWRLARQHQRLTESNQ